MMNDFEILVLAVLNKYQFKVRSKERVSYDFQSIKTFGRQCISPMG